MAVTTYQAFINKIRELSFDRYITPTFFICQREKLATWSFKIFVDKFVITDNTDENNAIEHTFLFTDFTTLDDLITGIQEDLADNIELIYSGGFIATEPTTSLKVTASFTLEKYQPVFRKYYFSDAYIEQFFNDYAFMYLRASQKEVDDVVWATEFSSTEFVTSRQEHFALWTAYQLVGRRRLYELANTQLLQSTLGGIPGAYTGEANFSSFSMQVPGEKLDVRIGDVFTLSEDSGSSLGISNGGDVPAGMLPPWAVGTDNELMDYYSFWYRLQLWLRNRFETLFGDQNLRNDTVVKGQFKLDQYSSRNYWSWFESYPWAWSNPMRNQRTLH